LFVAFLVYEKITNIFGPLKFQNGKLAAKPLYTWRVAEAFNYPSNNQKKESKPLVKKCKYLPELVSAHKAP